MRIKKFINYICGRKEQYETKSIHEEDFEIVSVRVYFDPAKEDKNIEWNLGKFDCYKTAVKKYGKCSLSLEEPLDNSEIPYYRGEFSYCRMIMIEKDFIEYGLHSFPEISFSMKTGKYYITDGTHRLCIAKQHKRKILVELSISKKDLSKIDPMEIIYCRIGN